MLKIGIVGCGKIADSHAAQIKRISGCEIVAACDREELMAQQLCERFAIKRWFSDLGQFLQEEKPDVVHITTPPKAHFQLGKQCLEAGCHIYVEKPFTIDATEAEALLTFATQKRLKVTVGHDDQFSHAARRMRDLARDGYLGGPPVHMESYYCYDLSEPGYAKALLANKRHWVRQLPGGLLQNVISHGIARITEFFKGDAPTVQAYGFTSSLLQSVGEEEIVDELRVILCDQDLTTAYFTFSSQMRPSLHQFRIYGPKNGLLLDEDQQTVIRLPGERLKSYAEKFVPPVRFAADYLQNFGRNARIFLARDFQMKSGMKFLIESFYRSITQNQPLPIPYREILLSSRIMDAIFEQVSAQRNSEILADKRDASLRAVLS